MTEPDYQRREVMGIHLDDDPDLEDKEKHGLTLTADGKLRVDDPTTQAAIAALDDKIDLIQIEVDALDGEAMRGTDNAETEADAQDRQSGINASFDGIDAALVVIDNEVAAIEVKLDTPANFMADITTLATAAKLEDAMQKATGPAYNQDTDSLEAIREVCDSIVTAMS